MAFRNVNKKRHIGLHHLSSLTSTGRTLLGPGKSSKFIIDENTHESVLICSVVRLVENLNLNSAAGQLLHEVIQAQNKEYKTGMATLFFLVHAWSNAVLKCLEQDVPLSIIVNVMSEGLNSCIEEVQCLTISVDNIYQSLDGISVECNVKAPFNINSDTSRRQIMEIKTPNIKQSNSCLNPPEQLYASEELYVSEEKSEAPTVYQANTCASWQKCVHPSEFAASNACSLVESVNASCVFTTYKGHLGKSNHNKRPKLTHSRYFSSVRESNLQQQTDSLAGSTKHFNGLSDLEHLAMSLSHGCWPSIKLVQDILTYQLQTASKMADTCPFQLNLSEVVTCCLPGMSENHFCVCPGYVTLVCPEKAAIARQLQDRPLRIILADGDLTETYHHLGFNRPENIKVVLESMRNQADSSSLWTDAMLDILIRYRINLILVQGNTCGSLEGRCLLNNIMVINQVTQSVLKAFSDVTQAERVTYLTQVDEHCIGKGVCMSLWGTPELRWVELNNRVPVAITVEGIHLLTAVLCSPVISKMQATEDQFWTCAYRVHHALLERAVFPGSGAVEFLCLGYLENLGKAASNSIGEFHGGSWLAKSLEQYKPLVLNALACGWHQYLCTVLCHAANCGSEFEASTVIQQHLRRAARWGSLSSYVLNEFREEKMGLATCEHVGAHEKSHRVYDNVTAKLEAWRRALDLVLLVLQTDAEIISGPKRDELLKSHVSSEFMFL
ncbi:Bardet-Biedl syndrome 12 protein [Tiliqua scincoides]|uniref:Bardet-Biedl syndrome 12 protein n=1 Tax=Tiliqua scincoides TaxID=71010 RepID=UPI0034630903